MPLIEQLDEPERRMVLGLLASAQLPPPCCAPVPSVDDTISHNLTKDLANAIHGALTLKKGPSPSQRVEICLKAAEDLSTLLTKLTPNPTPLTAAVIKLAELPMALRSRIDLWWSAVIAEAEFLARPPAKA